MRRVECRDHLALKRTVQGKTDLPAIAEPLDRAALRVVADGPSAVETVGPDTDRPAIVVRRGDVDGELARRLATLPCPVIGIGDAGPREPFDVIVDDAARLRQILVRVAAAPLAAMVLVQLLRIGEGLDRSAALTAESMAYATVQAGPEFRRWLATRRRVAVAAPSAAPPVRIERNNSTLTLTLDRPRERNAIGVTMRDALWEAFDLAVALGDDVGQIMLTGAGRFFSTGGDLAEFGEASDPATAHWVRSIRLPALRLLPIADRVEARLGGGAIGAGLEIAAFAARVTAAERAWFQLPELAYGLIPGAGGTVSVPRRVGRHRAADMMLSGRRLRADEALAWGLIDATAD